MEALALRTGSHSRKFIYILCLFLLTRLYLVFAGYLGMNLFPSYTSPPVYETFQSADFTSQQMKIQTDLSATRRPAMSDLLKFDTVWYVGIAEHGYDKYRMDQPHTAANWVFFPLYPVLITIFDHIFKYDAVTAGSILSNVFLLVALFYLYGICRLRNMPEEYAQLTILLLLIFPTSVFYAVPYTESLFLMLSVMSVYYSMKGNYLAAFLLGGFSTVTRNIGFLNVAFTVGTILIERNFRRFQRKDLRLFGYALLSALPLTAFLIYMKIVTGDFLAPLHEQTVNWYRKATIPFSNYFNYIAKPYFSGNSGWENGLISFLIVNAVIIVFVLYLILRWKSMLADKQNLLFFVYGLCLLLIPFASAEFLQSMPRYVMVAFPFYVFFMELFQKRKALLHLYLFFFFLLNVIYTICYFNGYFFVV